MAKCPPGVICLSNGMVLSAFIVTLLMIYLLMKVNNEKKIEIRREIIEKEVPISESINLETSIDIPEQIDPRRFNVPQLMPINIKTRGETFYQQIGALYKISEADPTNTGNNTEKSVLPLYGRPTYSGSSQWNYYTNTDSYQYVQLPIFKEDQSCTDTRGCKEIFTGDTIKIDALNGNYKVELYNINTPKYIPYVL